MLRELAASDEFQAAVDYSVKPSRMADREMVLRFLAFRMTEPLDYRQQDFDQDGEKDDRQPIGADGGDQRVRGQQVVEITQPPADGVAEDRPPEKVNGKKEVEKLAQGFYC